jgi:hypothetical protein
MLTYIQVTELFFTRNNFFTVEPNSLFVTKTLEGRYVTAENSYSEFQNLFDQSYDFVLVDRTFYNEHNGMVLIPEMTRLWVRKANDGNYVVDKQTQIYFSNVFNMQEPVVQYTMMDFEDTYLTLGYDDFDHSMDII